MVLSLSSKHTSGQEDDRREASPMRSGGGERQRATTVTRCATVTTIMMVMMMMATPTSHAFSTTTTIRGGLSPPASTLTTTLSSSSFPPRTKPTSSSFALQSTMSPWASSSSSSSVASPTTTMTHAYDSPKEEVKEQDPSWTRQSLAIAVPALLGLVADPVLSMVDTGFVGSLGSGALAHNNLAALGVCTSIFHMTFTIFRASTVATTSLMASASTPQEKRHIAQVSLQLAGLLGSIVLLGLRFGGPALLALMGVPRGSALFAPACDYLFARCWAAPAVVGIVVAEGAFRGNDDSTTPLLASAVAAVLNLILDPLLMFPLAMGMTGAAAATAISQFGAAALYGWRLWKRRLLPQPTDAPVSRQRTRSIVSSIVQANLAMLAKQGSMLVFYTLATARATRMGTVHVATHQIALSLFWLVTMWLDSGSISAQVLMAKQFASTSEQEKQQETNLVKGMNNNQTPQHNRSSSKVRSLTKYMLKYSLLQGVAFAALVGGLGSWGVLDLLTSDATIRSLLRQCLPHLAVQQLVVSLTLIMEGLAMGDREGRQFQSLAAGTAVSTLAGIYQLQRATSVVGIWSSAVNTFFGLRLVNAMIGVARVHHWWGLASWWTTRWNSRSTTSTHSPPTVVPQSP